MTRLHLLVLFAIAAFVFATACKTGITSNTSNANNNRTTAQSQATPDHFAAVRTIYEKDCKECHGQKGEGGPVTLKDGTRLKVPALGVGHALRHSDAEFVKQITKGGDGMPAFADKLKAEEINDLIKFIRAAFQAGATPPAK